MTDTVLDIIKRLSPGFPVDELLDEAGGRVWRIPYRTRRDYAEIRLQIMADPCRDIKEAKRRYHVSHEFIYRIWRAA